MIDNLPQERFDALIQEAIAIRWLIFSNGGMATKTAVEDVLMLRHEDLDRYWPHIIMNHIGQQDLDGAMLRNHRWSFPDVPEPQLSDYPEISKVDVRWRRWLETAVPAPFPQGETNV